MFVMPGIDNIYDVDLNLLFALDALLVERSVTRAARRVGVTQPSMSHSLARLRTLLDDPILVRTAKGLVASPRAEALEQPIRRALADIGDALRRGPEFDPATARRTFTIATGDYGELVILPPLLARLARDAPGIDLRVHAVPEDYSQQLEDLTFDLIVAPQANPLGAGLVRQKLFEERFVCVMRKGHPALRKELDLQTFVGLPHALVAPRGRAGSFVDDALAAKGLSRRVALMIPHFLVAPLVIASSDLVITLAARVANTFAEMVPLVIRRPPLMLPGFTTYQVWHERRRNDPAHAWLRKTLAEVSIAL
jgi:DNA-binding transcriptional LysR family regulator